MSKGKIILFVIFTGITISGLLFFCYKKFFKIDVPQPTIQEQESEYQKQAQERRKEQKEREIIEANMAESVVWKTYKNNDLGIEFEYPTTAVAYSYANGNYNKCEEQNKEKEYWEILVPYGVFVGENELMIKENYYFTQDEQSICQKVFITFDDLKKVEYDLPWDIKIVIINNRQELADYIKNNMGGGGCSLGEIRELNQRGVYEVDIKSDGKGLDESTCGLNLKYYLRYVPSKGRLFLWNTGQECIIGAGFHNCFDEQVVNSMRFEI